jgi:hypothetical protein
MLKSNPFVFAKIKNLWSTSRMPERFVAGRERGISLIEGILYLVLAISIIAGGIVLFQNAQLSNRVTDTSRGIVLIASETRGLFQNSRDFGDEVFTDALKSGGSVPSNFETATGLRNPFGGDVIVTGIEQQFSIQLTNIQSEACVRLSQVDARGQGALGVGIAEVDINGEAFTDGVSLTNAATECGDAPATITVTYNR